MTYPLLSIDLFKIEENASYIYEKCRSMGIEAVGVTKGCYGNPKIASSFCNGGIKVIADSRLDNLEKLHQAGFSPLMMLRQPMYSEVKSLINIVEYFLISETTAAKWLSSEAVKTNKQAKIIMMIELGDGREGFNTDDFIYVVREINDLPGLKISGIGTNIACLGGVKPTPDRLKGLVDLKISAEEQIEYKLDIVSGGNSSAWNLIENEKIPSGVNQLRIGEAILLGQETVDYMPINGTFQDAIKVKAEVLEVRKKQKKMAVLAIGIQELGAGSLKPVYKDIKIGRVSSDHLVIEFLSEKRFLTTKAGDAIDFIPDYFALLALSGCRTVKKRYFSSRENLKIKTKILN